jgi:UDP-N-acetylmuramate dehydrogenase
VAERDLGFRGGFIEALRTSFPAPSSPDDRMALEVEADAPLSRRTTFGIGGPADVLVSAKNEAQVQGVLAAARDADASVFVLGGGSNLLVGDGGIRGVVLTLEGDLASLTVLDGGKRIHVGCGCSFPRLTRTALDLGWPGGVGWMGTPGQVGGAIMMNAGSRWGEVGDDVDVVYAVDADATHSFTAADCAFSYRSSRFQKAGVGGARIGAQVDASITSPDQELTRLVLTRVILQCDKSSIEKAQELDATAKELLARRHRTQPKLRSAGSLFKNPPGDFAGRLIEAAGLKGFTVGRAQISPVHANFVVNLGGAKAADVVALADQVCAAVLAHSGVQLEWEVRRVGDFTGHEVSV